MNYLVKKNKKILGTSKIKTSANICIDDFVCPRSKMYAFKSGNYSKNKLKCASKSQSKHIKTEKYKNCLDGIEYQRECNFYILRSINHEMHLQEIKKSTLSFFDDKRCYINETESIPWNCYYKLVVKVKEKVEKTRHVKNNDKSKKYILRGEINVRCHERILSHKKKSYKFSLKKISFLFV